MVLSANRFPLSDETDKSYNYRELRVWKMGIEFTNKIYLLTKNFPKDETFGLSSQLKRAAVSIPSNIAEGSVKRSNKDFARFLQIAYGSIAEIDTQLTIAEYQNFVDKKTATELYNDLASLRKMLNGLRKSLGKSDNG